MTSDIPRCQNNKCLEKIDSVLIRYYDFICLQEASNYQALTSLQSRASIIHQVDRNVLITCYDDTKYFLDNNIKGFMKDNNRLFMISFFNSRLAIINVHAGHDNDIANLQAYILQYIDEESLSKLQTYDIILMGDFNDTAYKIDLFGRKLKGAKTKPTCCYAYSGNKFYSRYIPDHILSNMRILETVVHDIVDASDHKPVSAEIELTWLHGYDYDGVIQSSVGKPDSKGERNQIYPLIPSIKFLKQISRQIREGERVVVITARDDSTENEIRDMVSDLPIYFTDGDHKTDYLFRLGVNSYYDDSPLRIDHIIENRDRLPLLEDLFMVYPETGKVIRV